MKLDPTAAITIAFMVFRLAYVANSSEPVEHARDIQPIFAERCLKCHGPDDQNGGLRFDQKQSVFSEADTGKRAIVAWSIDESELVKRI